MFDDLHHAGFLDLFPDFFFGDGQVIKNNEGFDHLHLIGMGNADDADFLDTADLGDHTLDLGREDRNAGHLDDPLDPLGEMEESVE